jgi:hypothetical protein
VQKANQKNTFERQANDIRPDSHQSSARRRDVTASAHALAARFGGGGKEQEEVAPSARPDCVFLYCGHLVLSLEDCNQSRRVRHRVESRSRVVVVFVALLSLALDGLTHFLTTRGPILWNSKLPLRGLRHLGNWDLIRPPRWSNLNCYKNALVLLNQSRFDFALSPPAP